MGIYTTAGGRGGDVVAGEECSCTRVDYMKRKVGMLT